MEQYLFAILAIIIAVLLIKKFVSCMVRIAIALVLLAILGYIYLTYFYV